MRYYISLFFICSLLYASPKQIHTISGKVLSKVGCVKPTQLFISIDDKLLYQIEVPINGSFSVAVKKGEYNFLAINEEGCQSKKIKVVTDNIKKEVDLYVSRK